MLTSEHLTLCDRSIAVVANEFFDAALGGMGGYGWVAREAAMFLAANWTFAGRDPVLFLTGNYSTLHGVDETRCHGLPLLFNRRDDWNGYAEALGNRDIGTLLTVDYRPTYDFPMSALPEVPVIVWVQDPRPEDDIAKVKSLRIPGTDTLPQGIDPIDCTPLRDIVKNSKKNGRPVLFASPAPGLLDKAVRTFDVEISNMAFLPYLLDFDPGEIRKSAKPSVVYLGRLDPIKRPWVFFELARRFPDVDFLMLGQAHFSGAGAWKPSTAPDNLKLFGHLEGEQKRALLAAAWAVVNTSIHEALPVSFLESLIFECPIVSCQNPESITTRFGNYVGRWDGTGLEALDAFEQGLSCLLSDSELRWRLGREGRKWVQSHHGRSNFYSSFAALHQTAHGIASTSNGRDLAELPTTTKIIPLPTGLAAWHFRRSQVIHLINSVVPKAQDAILIDDNQLAVGCIESRRIVPFLEHEGNYFGAPSNEEYAIYELERMRKCGIGWLAIAWPAFWWREFYITFMEYLKMNYRLVHNDEDLIVFDLRLDVG